jgi:hypothetical protein
LGLAQPAPSGLSVRWDRGRHDGKLIDELAGLDKIGH